MYLFRPRRAARHLARTILASLANEPSRWVTEDDYGGICSADVSIVLWRGRYRLFDAVHVRYDHSDVWLPLLWRWRIRRAYRQVIADKARHALLGTPRKKAKKGRM